MLSLIIPGKKSVTREHFDMYLQPLLDEFKKLWRWGVPVRDTSREDATSDFNVKAMLLFTVHDYPAYGIVAGVVTKGYKGCVCCGPNNICRRSAFLRKNVWDHQHRRYLPQVHWIRNEMNFFRGVQEHRQALPRMTGRETRLAGQQRDNYLRDGGVIHATDDPVRQHGVKRLSILFSLPYWEVSLDR